LVVDGVLQTGYCLACGYFAAVRTLATRGDPLFVCWSFSRCAFFCDLKEAFKELRVMVAGGVKLEEAFQYVGTTQSRVAHVFREMRESLLSGVGVGGVMRNHLGELDVVLVGVLSVCESAKQWSRSVEYAISYLETRIRAIEFVKQVLLYPILVVSVLWGVVMFYVRFLTFESSWGLIALLIVTIVWGGLVGSYMFADRLTCSSNYTYAYYFSSLGLLMRSGHILQEALCIVSSAFQDEILLDVQEKVLSGVELHVALLGVSEAAARVMCAGECGGSVESACEHISELYLQVMQRGLARLEALLGPLILVFVGFIVVMLIGMLDVGTSLPNL
jgi:type II secretory pathway component PulF